MATGEKILTVNSFAQLDVSTQTPQTPGGLSTLGQIGAGSFEGGTPSLAQQEISQAEQNLSQGVVVQPSVSTTPNISPFPLGCPSGFYQSGDVCIPTVDTAGMNQPNAPAAGHELPKGSIQQSISDGTTTDGQPFHITVYFTNTGQLGKFFIHVTMTDIGVDVSSTGVWIPMSANGVLYKQILMPTTTPACTNGFTATIQLQHADPSGNMVVDDTDTVAVPCPGSAPPTPTPGPTPPPPQSCITFNNQQYCITNAPPGTPGCFEANGVMYCQVGVTQTPQCPSGYTYDSTRQVCVQTPTTPTCPAGTTLDTTNNICVQNPQPPPPSNMPQCFTISIDGLFSYASQYSRFVEIRQPNQLVIVAQGYGKRSSDDIQFCQTTTASEDSVTINNVIYAPNWTGSGAHMARIRAANANVRAYSADTGIDTTQQQSTDTTAGADNQSPNCFTLTLPALFEYANKQGGRRVRIRNAAGLVSNLKQQALPINNTSISFCKTNEPSANDQCVDIDGVTYCPQITHNENNLSSPVMIISPANHVRGGDAVTVYLQSFAPNETVTLSVDLQVSPLGSQSIKQGQNVENTHSGTTDSTGRLRIQIPMPGLPTGMRGHALIQALGSRSMKQAVKDVNVV